MGFKLKIFFITFFISYINLIEGACSTYGHSCYGAHGKKSIYTDRFIGPRSSENYRTEDEFLMSADSSLEDKEIKPKPQKYLLLNILLDKNDLNENINEVPDNMQQEFENGIEEIDSDMKRPSYKFKTPLKKRKFLYRISQPATIKPVSKLDDFYSSYKFLIKPKRIQNHSFISNSQIQKINPIDDINENIN